MSASVIVLTNPYFSKTGNDGRFTIANIPPGQYTLKTWHERKRPYEQKVTVEADKTTEINIKLKR
ncbi:MAG: carboxypeptidase-like regulatory domain-containing protein [Candidatus Mariimomonas ferrooxydans]